MMRETVLQNGTGACCVCQQRVVRNKMIRELKTKLMVLPLVDRSNRSSFFHLSMLMAICFVLNFVGWNSSADAQEKLRWKFSEGDQFKIRFDQTIEQKTQVGETVQSMKINMEMEMDWKVKSVSQENTAEIDQEFTRMKIVWSVGEEAPLQYDSTSKAELKGMEKRVADLLGPILSAKVSTTCNTRGEFLKVDIDRETMKHLREAPDSMSIRKLFTPEGLSKTITQSTLVLPEKALSKGDQWSISSSETGPSGEMKYTRDFTYNGPKDVDGNSLEQIGVAGKIEFTPVDKPLLKPQVLTESSQKGELNFDQAKGNLVSGTLTLKLASETPIQESIIKASTTSVIKTKINRVPK